MASNPRVSEVIIAMASAQSGESLSGCSRIEFENEDDSRA
jgi:hypothetical protein